MATYEGEYSEVMTFDPREVIDNAITLAYGNSSNWVIWSSLMKIVIEPPSGDPHWFFYSANISREYLTGYIILWIQKDENIKSFCDLGMCD